MNQIDKIKFIIQNKANGSRRRLGEMIGVSGAVVSKWTNGSASPSRQTIKLLANIANINEVWFFDDGQDASDVSSKFVRFYLTKTTFNCGDDSVIEQDFTGNICLFEMEETLARSICHESDFF